MTKLFCNFMSVLSETPFISWYQADYSNIRIFCIIQIFKYRFPPKNIIHYSYSSNFDFRILFVIRIRPIFIIRCNTAKYQKVKSELGHIFPKKKLLSVEFYNERRVNSWEMCASCKVRDFFSILIHKSGDPTYMGNG